MATRRKMVKPESVIRRVKREARILARESEYWKTEARGQQKMVEHLRGELTRLQDRQRAGLASIFGDRLNQLEHRVNAIFKLTESSETRLDRIEQSLKPWWKQLWDRWQR